MNLLIATRNRGKAAEFRQMFETGGSGLRIGDLEGHDWPEPQETGRTFRANACLKATAYARLAGSWALADDSGLAVDNLGGAPGVFSARYAERNGDGSGDAANNACLLRLMRDVPDERRTARFICVLALANPKGVVHLTAEGVVEGRLLREPRGTSGFGYDPLFLIPSLGRTTAELAPEQKHAISHRGAALRRMRAMIERWKVLPGSGGGP